MSDCIPLIRAASLIPFLRWLDQSDVKASHFLKIADLSDLPHLSPHQPISVHSALRFLRELAAQEGPDIGCKVVSSATVLELALIGKVALGSSTPRQALCRVASAMPYHSSHEQIIVETQKDKTILREFYGLSLEVEDLHLIHQYVAMTLQSLCVMAGAKAPVFRKVTLVAHPEFGLDHLEHWLGPNIEKSTNTALCIEVDNSVLDQPFPVRMRDRTGGQIPPGMAPLRGDGSLSCSARVLITSMLEDGPANVERLAQAAGTSVRTLQRRLSREGTSFSALLEEVRQQIALKGLSTSDVSIGMISQALGYSRQATLSKAMQRWTGASPTEVRDKA